MRFIEWLFQRPPRPAPQGFLGRETIPTGGYSALELERAGISEEEARKLGLPLDRHRPSALGSNVMQLEAMVRRK
ncbi:MAG TPA: hypothetical protein VFI96_08705 [Longimicrobiaceae bacterium]|nr:hypothetical protein [Longimicrobiaceae bacterium]